MRRDLLPSPVVGRLLAALALVSLALVASGCRKTVKVDGLAMSPTIKDNEVVAVAPALGSVRRGDIVVFLFPLDESKSFAKRIVGLPGETVGIANGVVSVNGKRLDEPYVIEDNRSRDTFGPMVVPQQQYFVLGDNRRNSSDSRHWGCVRRSAIWGKVVLPASAGH